MAQRARKGDGSLIQLKNGLWRGRIELPPNEFTGKRRYKEVTSKSYETAHAKLAKLRTELAKHGDLATATPKLGIWLETVWLPSLNTRALKPKTIDGYKSKARLYIIPAIGNVKMEKLTAAHVERVINYVYQQGLSTTTAKYAYATLSKALKYAVRLGLIGTNPCEAVDAPPLPEAEGTSLTLDQAMHVLKVNVNEPILPALATFLMTGGRKGEIAALRVSTIDFTHNTIPLLWSLQRLTWSHGCKGACGKKRGADCPERRFDIPRGVTARQVDGTLWLLRPKSKRSQRDVPMMSMLAAILDRHISQEGLSGEDFLFQRSGKVISPERLYIEVKAALDRAGFGDIRLHDLRHTAATLMDAAGVPEHRRIAVLGHSTAAMTRHYTHADAATIAADMQGFDGLFRLDMLEN